MLPTVTVNFAHFWPGFSFTEFKEMFPGLSQRYDLQLTDEPQILFYSAFSPDNAYPVRPDGRYSMRMPVLPASKSLRVFISGENIEPVMEDCDFAITHSVLIDDARHLRLPMWAFPGYSPEALIQQENTDWEKVAAEKTRFCNFIYAHDTMFRNHIFDLFNRHWQIDAAGRCRNSMNGWLVPPGVPAKLSFIRSYKFTLAVENELWPGYQTEKLVHPMFVNSIPIYFGDPLAHRDFDPASYVDITSFRNVREVIEYVRELEGDRKLYIKMLSAPHYRGNALPRFAEEARSIAFFDRIFDAATDCRQ